ncbi:MAG: hypothetical protein V3U75_05965 [Methylococcaceae bacterium]
MRKIKSFYSGAITVVACFFISGSCIAKDLYTLGTSSSRSTDDIDIKNIHLSYINNRREYFWPYEESDNRNIDWGFDYDRYYGKADNIKFVGNHLQGIIGKAISKSSYVSARIGLHSLNVPIQDSQDNRLSYEIFTDFGVSKKLNISLGIADDFIYQNGIQPAGVEEFLSAKKGRIALQWRPQDKLHISTKHSLWDMSDDNTRKQFNADMLYGLSTVKSWVWAGIAIEELQYENDREGYWSPKQFRSFGVVFESSVPVTDALSVGLSANWNRIKENNNPAGNGGSIYTGFDYKINSRYILRAGMSRIISSQGDSTWAENTYRFSINGAL